MPVKTDLRALDAVNVEVCVVGSGPVGACLALDLVERGISVVILESGLDRADPAIQSLSDAVIEKPRFHEPMSLGTCRALGGTSRLWGGRCTGLEEIDFLARDYVPHSGWPFAYQDLVRFYPRAARLLGAGNGVFRDDGASIDFECADARFDQVEVWVNETRIHERLKAFAQFQRIRFFLDATVVDFEIDSRSNAIAGLVVANGRQRVVFRGAKSYVLAMGGVETARLLLNVRESHAPALFGGPEGALGRFYMGHLSGLLADIKFASPVTAHHFDFRDGESSASRRRITFSQATQRRHRLPNIAFWPDHTPISDASHKSGFLSAGYLLLNSGFLRSASLPDVILRSDAEMSSPYSDHLRNCMRDWAGLVTGSAQFLSQKVFKGRNIPRWFRVNRSGIYHLHYHAEQCPSPAMRITLADERDPLGSRRANINFSFSERDIDGIYRAHEVLDASLRDNSIGELIIRTTRQDYLASRTACSPDGLHQIGTTRMAADPVQGVINADCRVFDFQNLYVAGSSVFPTSGQANPTFSAVAIALRLAEHLDHVLHPAQAKSSSVASAAASELKILHVISSIDAASGGPARAVFDLALAARSQGHDVTIATTNFGGPSIEHSDYVQAGIKVKVFPTTGATYFQRSRYLDRYVRENITTFHIVHLHSLYLYNDWYVYRCATTQGVPYILRPHGTFDPVVRNRKKLPKWILDKVFQQNVNEAAVGIHYTSDDEQNLSNCTNRRSWVVPLPIRPEEFDGQRWDNNFLEKYGIAPDFILFLGRLAWKKGADLLVEAYGSFAKRFPGVDLVIAGPDHGEEPRLRKLVAMMGLDAKVHFVGMLDGPSRVAAYKFAKLFALPSRGENFGRTAAEAMLVGTPIVMTDCVGIWEQVAAADAAVVTKAEVTPLLAELVGVWEDYSAARERAARARKFVEDHFSVATVGEQLDQMYREALNLRCDSAGEEPRSVASN